MRLKHYKESLDDVHPSLDASLVKKPKIQAGADLVSQEIDNLNNQYTTLINRMIQRLNQLLDIAPREYISKVVGLFF